ncbi:MAG: hypothetical protein U9R66_08230 [Thermodesulfobacteriota bacterium]|nr:hypothetical protein [Thermodesulfobacteriota bacterium]
MMNLNLKSNAVIFAIALVLTVFFVAELVEARGRGGGGRGGGRSFSRAGVASGGGFSHNRQRVSNPRTRPVSRDHKIQDRDRATTRQGHLEKDRDRGNLDDRQEWRDEHRDDIQEARKERREDRQDFIDDERDDYWDDHRYGYGYGYGYGSSTVIIAGGAAETVQTTDYRTTLPCRTSAVVVNGVSYYNCSSTWYQRGYAGNQVTYIVVDSPAGY